MHLFCLLTSTVADVVIQWPQFEFWYLPTWQHEKVYSNREWIQWYNHALYKPWLWCTKISLCDAITWAFLNSTFLPIAKEFCSISTIRQIKCFKRTNRTKVVIQLTTVGCQFVLAQWYSYYIVWNISSFL